MNKRWVYIAVGALSLVTFELVLAGIPYANPPDWFRPLWIAFSILYEIIALPAHILGSFIVSMLPSDMQPPLLPKPRFIDLGLFYIAILLVCDAIEGAFVGWLFFLEKDRERRK